ncbi:hypothetical protein EG327_005241 [Venturia inaequalis]|uniref:Uncharacterized protein n=1 Tax=Venturia inaequalis TaxID=5025 RepID=A0A8H3V7U5_VENIN|nr:hypothetical protein EG327_005241 [Venturia inaequalis]
MPDNFSVCAKVEECEERARLIIGMISTPEHDQHVILDLEFSALGHNNNGEQTLLPLTITFAEFIGQFFRSAEEGLYSLKGNPARPAPFSDLSLFRRYQRMTVSTGCILYKSIFQQQD